MTNCPTCNGPIIDGLCCNGTPKECLQKWWNEHPEPPSVFKSLDELEPFLSFRERLAAIEERAQATDVELRSRIEALETAVRHGCPVEVA